MKRLTAREVEAIRGRYGFVLVSRRGAIASGGIRGLHIQVIVPQHRGQALPSGTLRQILLDSRVPESEWRSAS